MEDSKIISNWKCVLVSFSRKQSSSLLPEKYGCGCYSFSKQVGKKAEQGLTVGYVNLNFVPHF